MGIADAVHTEYELPTGTPIVTSLACSLAASEIELEVTAGSQLAGLFGGSVHIVEKTNCNFGINPDLQHIANEGGMVVSAVDETGEVRAIERPDHPFFVGTLFQPQLSSAADAPHPIFMELVRLAAG